MTRLARRLTVAWVSMQAVLWMAGCCSIDPVSLEGVVKNPSVPGAEDLTIDPSGVAYVSCTNRREPLTLWNSGVIYRYDLNAAPPTLEAMKVDASFPFHPHGIGLHAASQRLFVVNHRTEDDHSVEVFEIHGATLKHVASVFGDEGQLVRPNDVIPDGPTSFYVTNLTTADNAFEELLEMVTWMDLGSVYHCADIGQGRLRQVAANLGYANGIQVSPDGAHVYVGTTTGQDLRVYRPGGPGKPLQHVVTYPLGTGADNIEWDGADHLLIGCAPCFSQTGFYLLGWRCKAPAQVIRVALDNGRPTGHETVYAEDGSKLSASSVAARFGDHLLIGSIADGFLHARWPEN